MGKIEIIESVTLNFTDLTGAKTGCKKLGSNKFWKGWVEDLGGGVGNFECRWGPTGTPGSDKGSARGISLAAASKKLKQKVKSKEKKGYTRLDTRSDAEEMVKAAAKGVKIGGVKATPAPVAVQKSFHPDVGRLLGIIYNETSRVVRGGLSAQAGASEENPIGNLSDRQLDIGGTILDEIGEELQRVLGKETSKNRVETLPLASNGIPRQEIIELTNRFMSNVPRQIARNQRGPKGIHRLVLASYARLDEQRTFLQLLRDAHIAKDIFKQASAVTAPAGKEQVWYDGLQSDIASCDPNSAEFRQIKKLFETGQSRRNANFYGRGVQLVRVFKFTRLGTEAAYSAYKARMLAKRGATGEIHAWHGTRTENLLGIGKSGLLMPENLPRGVKLAGKAFGKGIYHAPVFNNRAKVEGYTTDGTNGALKSLNYTSLRGAHYGARNTASGAFMFLQNVALGRGEVHTSACWNKERPTGFPEKDFIYANAGGCSTLAHDELVTFNQDAQIFRYLCEFNR